MNFRQYDEETLKCGSYPYQLKRRIMSDTGHLSNNDAGKALSYLSKYNVQNIILGHLSEENNELLDEINFFTFATHLNKITTAENTYKFLEEKPYIDRYFRHNFQLLLPELFSFVLRIKNYDEQETINLFSSFSFRKRELCHKFYLFYNVKNMGRAEKKKAELLLMKGVGKKAIDEINDSFKQLGKPLIS